MHTKKYQHIVENVWQRCKPMFSNNQQSDRVHSWEQADEASMLALEEYFQGSAYRFAILLALSEKYLPKSAKVLDAGAGHGVLAISLKDMGFEAVASDLHHGLAIFEHEGIPYQRWHLEGEPAPFPDDSFDAIILSQTIEHFTYSPVHPLREMIRILRPGGTLIIDAPNISCFRNVSRLLRGKSIHWDFKKNYLEQQPEVFNQIPYYDRHNHEYSKEDLEAIADYFNLHLKELAYYSSMNTQKRGAIAVFVAHIRDLVRHWRKGIYAVYKLPN
jgi:SAM-dependent methyltransferase